MKIRILLATTAIIAAATAGDATAQTTSRKDHDHEGAGGHRLDPAEVERLPEDDPEPRAPGAAARGPSVLGSNGDSRHGLGCQWVRASDTTGRKDLSGRAVAFYPSRAETRGGPDRRRPLANRIRLRSRTRTRITRSDAAEPEVPCGG